MKYRQGSISQNALLEAEDEQRFAYVRETEREVLLVVCNFTAETLPDVCPERFRGAEVLLGNYPDPAGDLRPYETRMRYVKK